MFFRLYRRKLIEYRTSVYSDDDDPVFNQLHFLLYELDTITTDVWKKQALFAVKQRLYIRGSRDIEDENTDLTSLFKIILRIVLPRRKGGLCHPLDTTTTGELLLYDLNVNCPDLKGRLIRQLAKQNLMSINDQAFRYRNLRRIAKEKETGPTFDVRDHTREHYNKMILDSFEKKGSCEKKLLAGNQLRWLIREATHVTKHSGKKNAFLKLISEINQAIYEEASNDGSVSNDDVLISLLKRTLKVALKRHKHGIFHPMNTTTAGEKMLYDLNHYCPELFNLLKQTNTIADNKNSLNYDDLLKISGETRETLHGRNNCDVYYKGFIKDYKK